MIGIPPTKLFPSSNWLKRFLAWLILLAFLVIVQYWLGWQTLLAPWQLLNWQQLLLAFAFVFGSYLLRTWRIYTYFIETRQQYLGVLRLTLLHNLFNNLLPARSGEISFPMLMHRYFGLAYLHATSALLWFRFLDLHCIIALAIYPLLTITALKFKYLAVPLILLWMLLPLLIYGLRKVFLRSVADKTGKFSEIIQKMLNGLPKDRLTFWKSWGLTWLNWLFKLSTFAWVLSQFMSVPTWNALLAAVIGGELTSVLPLHAPAGLGTYEAGIVATLAPVAPLDEATRAAINLHIFVLGSAILGGIIAWLLPTPQSAKQISD